MSLVSAHIQAAIEALNEATDQTVEYRAGISGSWTALAGAFFQAGPPEVIMFDEQKNAIMAPARARMKVKVGATRLVPGTPDKPGYQVRHTLSSNVTQWAVIGAAHSDAQSIYELVRAIPQFSTNDPRGAV